MDFLTFAAAPTKLADPVDGQRPTSRVQVAVLADDFTDPRYGEFSITPEHVANWQRLLASHFGGEVHIDLDHGTDYHTGSGSEAAGWITSLDQMGADGTTPTPHEVWAAVEWTPLGATAITEKRFQWISPVFTDDFVDSRGNHLGPALARAALTNDPFLREMATVSLSGATLAQRRSGNDDPADSRRQMPEIKNIAEALGLAADADEAKVLSAIGDLAAKAAKADEPADTAKLLAAAPRKALTDALDAQGLVALSKDDHAELKANAEAGKGAHEELRLTKFDTAYQKVLDKAAVDTTDETKAEWLELYNAAPDATLKRLGALTPLVNLDRGNGTGGSAAADASGFLSLSRPEQVTKAKEYAAEHKIDFNEAVTRLSQEA